MNHQVFCHFSAKVYNTSQVMKEFMETFLLRSVCIYIYSEKYTYRYIYKLEQADSLLAMACWSFS